ncbi:MAG TPA: ATP-binding protein, partial [Nitrospiria bacterium]|nr:ATP-binding protein [Nitrospiria bacterium]
MAVSKQNLSQEFPFHRLKELEEKEQLFQSVLDGLPDAIEIIDKNFNVLYLNASARNRTERCPNPATAGSKCYQVFFDRKDPCPFCPAQKSFENGQQGYVLLKDVRENHQGPCFEELFSLPVNSNSDGVQWVVEIAKDVTREKEMEQQLISSERLVAIGEMAASIAHEFNNPLGIILGFTQDLMTEVDPFDPRFNSLRIIEEEARRLKKFMREFLEFGRPNPGEFAPVRVEDVIKKGIDLVASQFNKAKVETRFSIEENLPFILADSQQLMQVLVNLFFNALEAMPGGGEMSVKTFLKKTDSQMESGSSPFLEEVVVAVADTGCGISEADLPKIFRSFFTTKRKKGMGLGLSICESIIKAHGG